MRVSIFSVFKTVFLVTVLVALGVGLYVAYTRIPALLEESKPVERPARALTLPGREVTVEIPKGMNLSQVGVVLEQKGVISSRLVFKLVAMIRGEQRKLQAGEYVLKTGSDAGDILDQLISGKTRAVAFVVPEGYTVFQIGALFERWGLMSRDEFLKLSRDKEFLQENGIQAASLEGFLFPDTYFLKVSERQDGKALMRRMIRRFHAVYDKHVRPIAEKSGWTARDVVTLASLIEKESGTSEHPLVSSVFHNRLRKKMRLQCDPTVIYGIKPMGSKITRKDLQRDHPYNTYRNHGLPPGPIANPGKAAVLAAVKPAQTDYLYFVSKNDGTHHFSPTLREHTNNVNKYQRKGRSKKRPQQSKKRR